jgi:hypothetical protein
VDAMDSSLDKLLAELKNEYDRQQKERIPPNMAQSDRQPSELDNFLDEVKAKFETTPLNSKSNSEVEDLLAEFKNKQEKRAKSREKSSPGMEDFLAELKTEFAEKKLRRQDDLSKSLSRSNERSIERIQSEYKQKKQTEERSKQQENLEQIKLEELKKQRKRNALTQKAQEWLKNLDPTSDEGLWFEEFSYAYESKLEAAIDYLEALGEVRFL